MQKPIRVSETQKAFERKRFMTHQGNGTPASSLLPSTGFLDANDGVQLSKLSSVLNGLEGGAQLMQRRIHETMSAIQAGNYRVDAIKLSRRIVGEALRLV
jgi:anti-sigma28 factor (negative regulator of flagellin synthesis)